MLSICGPERLCEWCQEYADDCSCSGPLTRNYHGNHLAQSLSSYAGLADTLPRGPRPVRTTERMSADERHFIFAHEGAGLPRQEAAPLMKGPTTVQLIQQRLFWCPYCDKVMPIHVCVNVELRAK